MNILRQDDFTSADGPAAKRWPTAASAIAALEKLHILEETTGRQRDRVFTYAAYLKQLRVGTDLGE